MLRHALAEQTRQVPKDGIHFGSVIFIAPELTRIGGKAVEVRYMPHDLRKIEVFAQDGWLCTAYPQDQLTREQAEAVIAQRREAAREVDRRRGAARRKGENANRAIDYDRHGPGHHRDRRATVPVISTRRSGMRRPGSHWRPPAGRSAEQAATNR